MKKYLMVILLLGLVQQVRSQKPITLRMGDKAPQFAYSDWVKGSKVSKLDGDRIYVLEFWATWCLPCIASMPHLSELAEEYAGKVAIIAVNVKERTGEKAYSSVIPNVKDFVRNNADKMRFNVIVDNDERVMDKKWLEAAGVVGIPATFIVKNDQLIWIGHPNGLSKVLRELSNGTYDLIATKTAYEKTQNTERSASAEFRRNMFLIDSAVNVKSYDQAISIAQAIIEKSPKANYAYRQKILDIYLSHSPDKRTLEYIRSVASENKATGMALAAYLATKDNTSKELYETAARMLEENEQNNTYHLDCLATLYAKLGQFGKAADTQQKVVNILDETNKNGSKVDLTDVILTNKKKVDDYRSKMKGKE